MYEWKEPGFDLDLRDMRLVRFGLDEAPVWMTELEKIETRAKGLKFMDM
jgi:leucyl aminopeptidase